MTIQTETKITSDYLGSDGVQYFVEYSDVDSFDHLDLGMHTFRKSIGLVVIKIIKNIFFPPKKSFSKTF